MWDSSVALTALKFPVSLCGSAVLNIEWSSKMEFMPVCIKAIQRNAHHKNKELSTAQLLKSSTSLVNLFFSGIYYIKHCCAFHCVTASHKQTWNLCISVSYSWCTVQQTASPNQKILGMWVQVVGVEIEQCHLQQQELMMFKEIPVWAEVQACPCKPSAFQDFWSQCLR